MTERRIGQLSLKGHQTLEGLDKKGQQIDFAVSRLGIVLDEIGTTNIPSYLRKGRRDSTKRPLFEKLNAHNFDSLPALQKRDRFLQTAGIITNIAEIIIPSLKEQKSDLAKKIAEAARIVEEAEEVKKLKQILEGLEELKTNGVGIGDESITAVKQDLNYLRRNATIYFDSPTLPPTEADAEKKPAEITVELPTAQPWSVPQALERKLITPSPRRETFNPTVSDINLGILNRIINDPKVTVENVLDDLGIGLNNPVSSKEAISILKEAVNYLWLRINELKATADETNLWASIQVLAGKGDMAKDLREFHTLLEKWFEKPKKQQPVQEAVKQTTKLPTRHTSKHPLPKINIGSPQEPSLKVITIESAKLARGLIDLIPEKQLNGKPIEEDVVVKYPNQALTLASFVIDVGNGAIKPITDAEIMQTADSQKMLVAQNAIRQRLAQLIIRNPDKPLEAYRFQWARDARDIMDWLGKGGIGNFAQAINSLPEFEKAMVIAISSLNLLEDLGYLDLDECNEESFVSYIRNASFIKDQTERDSSFELLINTLVERCNAGTIDPHQAVEGLLELDYADLVFERLIESAKLLSFQDRLVEIFSIHTQTVPIAKKLQQGLRFGEPDEEILPKQRIMP